MYPHDCHHRPSCLLLKAMSDLLAMVIVFILGFRLGIGWSSNGIARISSLADLVLLFFVLCDLRINIILTRRLEQTMEVLSQPPGDST